MSIRDEQNAGRPWILPMDDGSFLAMINPYLRGSSQRRLAHASSIPNPSSGGRRGRDGYGGLLGIYRRTSVKMYACGMCIV